MNAQTVKDVRCSLTWVRVTCPCICSSLFYRRRTPKLWNSEFIQEHRKIWHIFPASLLRERERAYNFLWNAVSWGKRWRSLIWNINNSLWGRWKDIIIITLRMGANGRGEEAFILSLYSWSISNSEKAWNMQEHQEIQGGLCSNTK